jgi:predicted phage gp36 major capsid-like protein
VRGVHVDREHGEVDVVDAEALREHARELVAGQRAAGDQRLAGRAALRARLLDGGLDLVARRQPEVDDDLADQARDARARAGGNDSRREVGGRGGRHGAPSLCV